jgi:protein-S-isoprenylcysteine O-methyltransferase Ste14
VLGVLLRLWSVHTLGRFFQRQVVVEPGQTIIRSGPYRWVRHPAYSGNLVTVFGVGLMLGSWVAAIVGFGIGLLAHLPRIYVEEAALGRAFGAEYARYVTQTARLIPRLW